MLHRIRSEIAYRLRSLFRRNDVEQELDAELRFHIDRETTKLVGEGVPRAEAERRARAAFGGVERIKDDTRDSRGIAFIDELTQDVRYGLRALAARKAFTFGVVATLALGIGANATMFGVVDRLLFRPPHGLRDASHVHRFYRGTVADGEARPDRNFAFPTYIDLKENLRSFSDVAAFLTVRRAIGDGDAVREVPVTVATGNYFDFFDVQPIAGRFFTAADDVPPEGSPVAVLGFAFWQEYFGGRDVVGQQLRIGASLYAIIGIAPRNFVGMSDQGVPSLFTPLSNFGFLSRGLQLTSTYTWSWLEAIGRRKHGVSVAAAETELAAAFVQSWRKAYAIEPGWGPPEAARITAQITPVQVNRGPQAGQDSLVAAWIAGVAIIVLLIACANVANLLLSRAASRRRETAVRLALGASRWRVTRQLLMESLLLALLGAVAGLAIAQWGAAGLRRWFLPADLPVSVFTDARTLLFATAATFVVAIATGLVPAIRAGRADVAPALKSGSRGAGHQHGRMRNGLLVFQVSLSVVLLVGAGLFVRSLSNATAYRLGYDADRMLFATARLRGVRLAEPEARALAERLLAAAKTVPGVTHATTAQSVPFAGNDTRGLVVPGVDSVMMRGRFILQLGSPEYFATTGTRILRGRAFDATDRAGTTPVVVVSEGMARALWRDTDPLGHCVRMANPGAEPGACMTVIGVAEEMRLRSFADAREFAYYVPVQQVAEAPRPQLLVRASLAPERVIESLRERLQAEMPGTAYVSVTPMMQLVEPNFRSWRLGATMFAAFGVLALVIAAVGLYSLVAYDVAERRRELSVRVALGASARRVIVWVVGRGARLIGAGIVIGSLAALWTAPKLETLLFQQAPRDSAILGVVVATLLGVGLLATAVPAMRAARVDPNDALRAE